VCWLIQATMPDNLVMSDRPALEAFTDSRILGSAEYTYGRRVSIGFSVRTL
jgi:hypothetical protein